MIEIPLKTFLAFRVDERKNVKLILRSHEGVMKVKTALIDFVSSWNDKEWVDWEKIEMVFHDLKRVNFWRIIPYSKFLDEAKSKVSVEIMAVLRKQSF